MYKCNELKTLYIYIFVNFFSFDFSTGDPSAYIVNEDPDLSGQTLPNQFETVYISYQWGKMVNSECVIEVRGYLERYMSVYI